jgi:regulator of sigma E protease
MATPQLKEIKDRFGNPVRIGLLGIENAATNVTTKDFGPVGAVSQSLSETWFWMQQPFVFIKKIVIGQASGEEVRGIVGIAELSRGVASLGFVELFRWIAIISINIGLLNLFPIPILDGGHLLFYGIEAIRGRPLSERVMEIGFRIGFALVIMLMLFATRNDVIHLLRRFG